VLALRPSLCALLLALACAAQAAAAPAPKKTPPAADPKIEPPAPAPQKPAPKGPLLVALLPLRGLGVAPEAVAALETTLRNEAGRLPEVLLSPQEQVAAALQREPDCNARIACSAAAASKTGAGAFVAGTVGELGDAYMVDLKLVDAKSGQELRRVTHPVSGRQELLIELLRAAAVELLAPLRFVGRLSVSLLGDQQGPAPLLYLDGRLVGPLPLPAPVGALTPGQHTLRVTKEGFRDATLFVEVRFDRTTEARVDLARGQLSGIAFLKPDEQAAAPPVSQAKAPPQALAPPKSPLLKIAGWSGVGLGVISAVVGVALHAKAYATASELNRKEASSSLTVADVTLYDTVDREVSAARVLYVLGAALGGGGAALLIYDARPDAAPPAAPAPKVSAAPVLREGGGGLALEARF
jgi:PEGA domain